MNKFLVAVLLLALLLRFYKLASYPVSISWDEAAIGYNAFSIAKTAKDEYGTRLPILFKSFNDYKLPGYIYIDAAVVKLFGLSDFSVRVPSAFFGVLSVLMLYVVTKYLFNQKVALIAAFLMAISPWHVQFSRAAFEANVSLAVFLIGLAALFLGAKNKIAALISLPIIVLSLYFYYSPRILILPVIASFIILYHKKIWHNIVFFKTGFVLALLLALPVIVTTFTEQGQKRTKEVSIFSEKSIQQPYINSGRDNILGTLFLNRRTPYLVEMLKNYASHFSPVFFFFAEDPNPRHRAFNHGNFYLFEAATILYGAIILVKMKNYPARKMLLIWLFVSPIPASLATETPHSLRSLFMLPPLLIVSALGFTEILKYRKVIPFLHILVFLSIINYLVAYYILYPKQDSTSWAYGHKQVFEKLKQTEDKTDRIVFTGYFWKPYIFYLYYNQVDPAAYQKEHSQSEIDKYRFLTTYWDSGKNLEESDIQRLKEGKTIVVISHQEYQAMKNKNNFIQKEVINDYSQSRALFTIGEWR